MTLFGWVRTSREVFEEARTHGVPVRVFGLSEKPRTGFFYKSHYHIARRPDGRAINFYYKTRRQDVPTQRAGGHEPAGA